MASIKVLKSRNDQLTEALIKAAKEIERLAGELALIKEENRRLHEVMDANSTAKETVDNTV